MIQEDHTPKYWYDRQTAKIAQQFPLTPDEAFEDADRMVDYAELPAFSSLPRCIVDELDQDTIDKLEKNEEKRIRRPGL